QVGQQGEEFAMLLGHEGTDGGAAGTDAGQRLGRLLVFVERQECGSVLRAHDGPSGFSGHSALGSYQGAASDRQMCSCGRSATAVSRQPNRSSTTCCATRSAMMCEPQRLQKRRNLPGE